MGVLSSKNKALDKDRSEKKRFFVIQESQCIEV